MQWKSGVQQKVCQMGATNAHSREKNHWVTVSQELLKQYEAEGNAFLDQIVTSDETWCHYYKPKSKRQSMQWHRSYALSTNEQAK